VGFGHPHHCGRQFFDAIELAFMLAEFTKRPCFGTTRGLLHVDDRGNNSLKSDRYAMSKAHKMIDRLDLQNAEFDALTKLAEEWRKLRQVAVVDDYYPEARHYYEGAMKAFVDAITANGRIRK